MSCNHSISLILASFLFGFLIMSGCSTRVETPVLTTDMTQVYPAKKENGIIPSIILTDKKNKESLHLSEDKSLFTIDEKSSVTALVSFKNLFIEDNRIKVIHLDWIGDNDRSFYRKRMEVSPDDSTDFLISSVAITPERRNPGNYKLKVYYFRELVAEKSFTLLPKPIVTPENINRINPQLNFIGKTRKEDTNTFYVNEKSRVKAQVSFDHIDVFDDRDMMFSIQWIDASGVSFYRKKFTLSPDDTLKQISSSITISPAKRVPGKYGVKVYLYDQLIDSTGFELKIKPKVVIRKIKADLTLFSKSKKETGELIGVGNTFEIIDKGKVRAVLNIRDWGSQKNRKQVLRFKWIDPKGKTLFTKKFDIPTVKNESTFKSSISATPQKRKPGKYSLQVYFGKTLIGKESFELH